MTWPAIAGHVWSRTPVARIRRPRCVRIDLSLITSLLIRGIEGFWRRADHTPHVLDRLRLTVIKPLNCAGAYGSATG